MKLVAFAVFIIASMIVSLNSKADQVYDEATVRYRLADSQLGGVIDFYRQNANTANDPASIEAVRRWDDGVRCVNLERFERKIVEGRSWMVVHKGTDVPINGLDVRISTDKPKEAEKPKYDEATVRYRLADSQLGGVIDFYRQNANTANDPASIEAVRRWDDGVRCVNLERFERKIVEGRSWMVVHKGTDVPINGLDVRISTDQ